MDLQGTMAPIYAKIERTQTILKVVDFPPMLGPVSSKNRGSSPPKETSFGTKFKPSMAREGCLASSILIKGVSSTMIFGLHIIPSET